MLEISDLERRGIVLCHENKSTDPVHLICIFVFINANSKFSHDAAYILRYNVSFIIEDRECIYVIPNNILNIAIPTLMYFFCSNKA